MNPILVYLSVKLVPWAGGQGHCWMPAQWVPMPKGIGEDGLKNSPPPPPGALSWELRAVSGGSCLIATPKGGGIQAPTCGSSKGKAATTTTGWGRVSSAGVAVAVVAVLPLLRVGECKPLPFGVAKAKPPPPGAPSSGG